MKPARIAVLAVAIGAAGLAALMMTGSPPPPAVVVEKAEPVPSIEVLVAADNIDRGRTLAVGDMRWQRWPSTLRPVNSITRDEQAKALEETVGSIATAGMLGGDPIRREKLIKADSNGFMSAILPAGMRGVAVATDTHGTNSAGGFILPNDRVDVIRVSRDEQSSKAAGNDVQRSEVVLSNIRVLAIGQTVQEKNGEKVVTGDTATLEVTAVQAETLTLAQKVGQLSLALRSLADAGELNAPNMERDSGLTIVRFGVSTRSVSN